MATKLKFDFGLNSNAVLVTEDIAKAMKQSGLKHVLVSILGPRDVHNKLGGGGVDFDKAISGIECLMRNDISVSTNMVVSKQNLETMFETATILKAIGIRSFCAGPMIPSCQSNISLCLSIEECKRCLQEMIRIENELKLNIDILEPLPRCMFNKEDDTVFARFFGNRTCSAAVSSCAISSSGNVRPCVQSDVIFGNIMKESFLKIWQDMASWANADMLPNKCQSCLAVNICEGGCRMSAKITSCKYNGQDMYMTEPIIDLDRACVLESGQKECLSPITFIDVFSINERCVIRQEVDAFLVCSNNRMEFLSKSGFDFIKVLKGMDNFTAREVADTLHYDVNEVLQVFERLKNSDILIQSSRKEESRT